MPNPHQATQTSINSLNWVNKSAKPGEVVVFTANQQPIAAVVSLKGVDRESLALSTSPEFLALIERARSEIAAGRTLSLDEMRKAVLP